MRGVYHSGSRELQDRFDTRRLADRIEERIVHESIDDDDRAFIDAATEVKTVWIPYGEG